MRKIITVSKVQSTRLLLLNIYTVFVAKRFGKNCVVFFAQQFNVRLLYIIINTKYNIIIIMVILYLLTICARADVFAETESRC